MKTATVLLISFFTLSALPWGTTALAEDKGKTDTSHTEHQLGNADMTGKMDMKHMRAMMKECMDSDRSSEICHQNMMKKCQMNMKKDDCQKMMKNSKDDKGSTDKY